MFRLRADGETAPAALTDGYRLAFATGVGLVVAAIVAAVTLLRPTEDAVGAEAPAGADRALVREAA